MARLPQKIERHLHREHPLLLLAKPPLHYEGDCACDVCYKTCRSFVYHCSLGGFDLDINCAFPPCLLEVDNQAHQFRRLNPSIQLKSFTCDACGEDDDGIPFICTMCQLVVHQKCISLPYTTKTCFHPRHEIVHTYSLGQVGFVEQYCGICQEEVETDFGGYYCPRCKFVAHVSCALDNKATESKSEEEEELGTIVNDEFMESAFNIIREIKLDKKIIISEIKHFSHQHNLIMLDEIKRDLNCDGCMLPIFSPFYSCAECKCFLHKSCIELPRQKRWQYHSHLLTLIPKARACDGVFNCYICRQYSHGFSYRCDRCDYSIDVRCFSLFKDFIKHEGHGHPLLYAAATGGYDCNACDCFRLYNLLRCTDCEFNLDFRCATLPHKVWHEYDRHPLFLTYIDPIDYQFYCDVCEKERDPKFWFYRCEECNFDAHPECVLGKYPYIKLGDTYTFNFHSRPLTLVGNIELRSVCEICGESFYDSTLGFVDFDCNFVGHRSCVNEIT